MPPLHTPGRTILYIGVDPDCLVVLGHIVRRMGGVHLIVARTGREGRLLAVSRAPSLILLDAQLAACDAQDFVLYLGRSIFTATIPLAVVSGREGGRMRFLGAGATAWIPPPSDIVEIDPDYECSAIRLGSVEGFGTLREVSALRPTQKPGALSRHATRGVMSSTAPIASCIE